MNARTLLYSDIRSNSTTPRRVAIARTSKEAGLRSPRTQLTNVQIEISVQGRRTEARYTVKINFLDIGFILSDNVRWDQGWARNYTLPMSAL